MVSKKWGNLRDSYRRYAKKSTTLKTTDSASKPHGQYAYWDSMRFLDANIRRRETTSCINRGDGPAIETEDDTAMPSEIVTAELLIEPEIQSRKKQKLENVSQPEETKSARTEPSMSPLERMLVFKMGELENRHMNFFRSLLPTVEKFSERQTFYFQSELLKLTQQVSDMSQT